MTENNRSVKLELTAPAPIRERLKRIADRRSMSLSTLLRGIITEWLADNDYNNRLSG